MTPPAGKGSDSLNIFSHRFIVTSDFKPEENIEIRASLLLSENLGQDYRGYAGYNVPSSSNNSVSVYELYANWLESSGLGFQVGRFLFTANNESFFSKNLDDPVPTRFDGGLLKYDKDYFNFQGGAFVVSQFQGTDLKVKTSNLFLISIDLKIDQSLLKNINLSFIRYNTKEKTFAELNNFTFPGQFITMYSGSITGEYQRFFYSVDAAIQQGDNVTSSQIMDANMIHGKAGMKLHRSSGLTVFSVFHRDTGDQSSTADKNESYNPMFYNHFMNAGRMNLLGWGNLTSYGLGFSMKTSDSTKIALEFNKFLRTSADAGVNGLSATGTNSLTLDDSGTIAGPYNNSLGSLKKDLGSELDLIIEFKSDTGLIFQSVTGAFQPGSYFEDYNKDKLIVFQRFGLEFFF
jgi:hypothetical protein